MRPWECLQCLEPGFEAARRSLIVQIPRRSLALTRTELQGLSCSELTVEQRRTDVRFLAIACDCICAWPMRSSRRAHRGGLSREGKTQAMPARRQFEHGDVLSQRTLRERHVTQLRGLACVAAPVAPPLRGEKDPMLAVAVALALALSFRFSCLALTHV